MANNHIPFWHEKECDCFSMQGVRIRANWFFFLFCFPICKVLRCFLAFAWLYKRCLRCLVSCGQQQRSSAGSSGRDCRKRGLGSMVLLAASKLCGAGVVRSCKPNDVYIDLYLARRQEGETRDNLHITTSHTLISFSFCYPSAFYAFIDTVIAREERKQGEKDQ